MCASVNYLFKYHFVAVFCYCVVNFTDVAASDNGNIFLQKERGFTRQQTQLCTAMLGLGGWLMQCVFVPLLTFCKFDEYLLLTIGTSFTFLHIGAYAYLTDPGMFMALEPFGCFPHVVTLTVASIVSGARTDCDSGPRDQGTLLGTLTALKMIASSVSPFVLEYFTKSWRSFSGVMHDPGFGFALMAVLLVPAILASGTRYGQHVYKKSRCGGGGDTLLCDSVSCSQGVA